MVFPLFLWKKNRTSKGIQQATSTLLLLSKLHTMRLGLLILILFCQFTLVAQRHFIENVGQHPSQVHHTVTVEGGAMFLENDRFTFNLIDRSLYLERHATPAMTNGEHIEIMGFAYQQHFLGANDAVKITGRDIQPTTYNYFQGQDKEQWAGGCRAMGEVVYDELYPNVDLKVYSNDYFVKYDFIVQPGTDPSVIQWEYPGDVFVEIDHGQISISHSFGYVLEQRPIAWEIIDGQKFRVSCSYKNVDGIFSFQFEDGYRPKGVLTIDPELIFSTYSGSTADNFGYTATFDSDGFLYSGSSAFGDQYPTTLGAYQEVWAGGEGSGSLVGTDIALSKYDTTGTFMVWSTLIGGTADELPHSLIVDNQDQLFLLGTTSSDDFPFTNGAYDTSFGGGVSFAPAGVGVDYALGSDIIVAKFSADGTSLLASTFVGGNGNDGINQGGSLKFNYADEMRGEVEIDHDGNICVASCTFSDDFPTVNPIQNTHGGGLDGCIFKLDPNLENLLWSTFLGGLQNDATYSLAIDADNKLIVAGGTKNSGFLDNLGYQTSFNGGTADGFLARLDPVASTIDNATYLGSPWYDQIYFVEIDDQGLVYAYGQTQADGDFFINNAAYGQEDSGMLVAKFEEDLSDIIWSTTIGTGSGKPNLSPTAFLVDNCGKIYISGWGGTTNVSSNSNTDTVTGMPVTEDAYQSTTSGSDFYLMVLDSDGSDIVYATFFGGNTSAEHVDGGTSRFNPEGEIYQSVCAGCGGNDDFPIHPFNAVSPTNESDNCNNGVFKFKFELPPVLAAFEADLDVCVGQAVQFTNYSTSGTTYLWDFGDQASSSAIHPVHAYDEAGVYVVELFVDNPGCGFSDTATATINVTSISPLLINASANPEFVEEGQSAQLNATPSGYTYLWTPAAGLDDPNIQNPVATPETTILYTVQVIDGDCAYSASVTVNVAELVCGAPFIYVPNAFTPNGDGQNDELLVRGVNITELYLAVYDRWGEKVFETENQAIGWDGVFEGHDADPAVFVYYLEAVCLDGQEYFEKGNVTLIR